MMTLDDFSQNYFALFQLPQTYAVNETVLSQQYRQRQTIIHPDRFVNGTAQEKRLSIQQATLTNEAYETLKSPLKRAEYLLLLLGFDAEACSTQLDPLFLMEQMSLRESLSEATEQADPYVVLDDISDTVIRQKHQLVSEIQTAFEDNNEDQWLAIYMMTQKLRFFDKLLEEVQHIEARLESA